MHLYREGDEATSVYIVINGELEVTKRNVVKQ
jgi:CRP-like cAMP-binding protein